MHFLLTRTNAKLLQIKRLRTSDVNKIKFLKPRPRPLLTRQR